MYKKFEVTWNNIGFFGTYAPSCVLQKVPEQLRLEITKKLVGDNWDYDEVLNIFHDELSARE